MDVFIAILILLALLGHRELVMAILGWIVGSFLALVGIVGTFAFGIFVYYSIWGAPT